MINRLEKLKEMEQASPGDTFLKFAIALEYMSSNKEESIRLFELILHQTPTYIPTYYQLGKLHEEMDNRKRAVEVYRLGMKQSEAASEKKTLRELQEALESIEHEQE
ncbi:MAG: hypothetical protein IPP77_01700 [Bacteroidetes bacterium]|nr:hypothetical protein [Bacteroidota bacterium]